MRQASEILIVDDDPITLKIAREVLGDAGLNADVCRDPLDAIHMLRQGHYRVLVTDMNMPSITGLELLVWLRQYYPEIRAIMITGYPSPSVTQMVLASGAITVLAKPFSFENFVRQVRLCLTPGLSTEIRQIQLSELLQVLSLDTRRRAISIEDTRDGGKGILVLEKQTIIACTWKSLDAEISLRGMAACHAYLSVDHGLFSEIPAVGFDAEMDYPLQTALMNAAQHNDEADVSSALGIDGQITRRLKSVAITYRSAYPERLRVLFKILSNQNVEIWEPENIPPERQANLVTLHHLVKEQGAVNWPDFWEKATGPLVLLTEEHEPKDSNQQLLASFRFPLNYHQISQFLLGISETGVSGHLRHLSLLSQIQLFLMTRRSKRLQINDLVARSTGQIFLDQGRVLEAEFGGQRGKPAFLELMAVRTGVVIESDWIEAPSRSLEQESPFRLLMEATNSLPELHELEKNILEKIQYKAGFTPVSEC